MRLRFLPTVILFLISLACEISAQQPNQLVRSLSGPPGAQITPILSDKCFFCDGPDPETRKEDLRLDVREEALASRIFVPGNVGRPGRIRPTARIIPRHLSRL